MMRRNEGIYRNRNDDATVTIHSFWLTTTTTATHCHEQAKMMINNEAFVGGTHDEETYHNPFIG
jgi:hypothetical protein